MMSEHWQGDIEDLHIWLGIHVENAPTLVDEEILQLRRTLIFEEMTETLQALRDKNMVEIADGIADSIVVLLGTAVSLGIHMQPIWDEVHASNMAKKGGFTRADGKKMKPEGWLPPRVEMLLKEQGWDS
jgi:predicted HAD superfamily Cof-like phosphohydrolase